MMFTGSSGNDYDFMAEAVSPQRNKPFIPQPKVSILISIYVYYYRLRLTHVINYKNISVILKVVETHS